MLDERIIKEVDRHVVFFVWSMSEYMQPILRPELSCDGHSRRGAYVIVKPVTLSLFEQFREAVNQLDGVDLNTTFIDTRRKWKLILSYTNLNELFHKQRVILTIGEELCLKRTTQ